jgi:hypothetical protein
MKLEFDFLDFALVGQEIADVKPCAEKCGRLAQAGDIYCPDCRQAWTRFHESQTGELFQ